MRLEIPTGEHVRMAELLDTIRGDLFFYDDQGTRYEQPYEGSASDQHVSTSFSAEHTSPDGMLRYSGTMELDAVD